MTATLAPARNIEALVQEQADPPPRIRCAECDCDQTSRLAASMCADQDRADDNDRRLGRFFRSVN